MKNILVWKAVVVVCLFYVASPVCAQPPGSPFMGMDFLVGEWSGGSGVVADSGGTSKGTSVISVEAGGGALLRRDHTDLFDASGKPSGGFDQIMLIYPEGGTIHADYTDGQHVIHYTGAAITPGKAVTFTSAAGPGPAFQLSYALRAHNTLAVTFAMKQPGQANYVPVAAGTLRRRGPN